MVERCEQLATAKAGLEEQIEQAKQQLEIAPSPLGSDAPDQGLGDVFGRAETVTELEAKRQAVEEELARECP
ncbi:MAG: hypothetical protein ACYC4L_17880 [Chloroflexota bacterium]